MRPMLRLALFDLDDTLYAAGCGLWDAIGGRIERFMVERMGLAPDGVPALRYVPVLSDALPEDGWAGRSGFVHRAVMQDLPDLSGHQVYACGAPVMVEAAKRDFVQHCGLPEDEFHADSFTSEADKHGATA